MVDKGNEMSHAVKICYGHGTKGGQKMAGINKRKKKRKENENLFFLPPL